MNKTKKNPKILHFSNRIATKLSNRNEKTFASLKQIKEQLIFDISFLPQHFFMNPVRSNLQHKQHREKKNRTFHPK
jgi:hypothetical protein